MLCKILKDFYVTQLVDRAVDKSRQPKCLPETSIKYFPDAIKTFICLLGFEEMSTMTFVCIRALLCHVIHSKENRLNDGKRAARFNKWLLAGVERWLL
jgi:hypothetical protein